MFKEVQYLMSNVVMTRVDARLIHGQVAVRWTKVLQAKKIVVVDNKSAADDFSQNCCFWLPLRVSRFR